MAAPSPRRSCCETSHTASAKGANRATISLSVCPQWVTRLTICLVWRKRLSGDRLPNPRETDALVATGEVVSASLLGIAIRGLGIDAISLSGPQAGIRTDETFGSARIAEIDPTRVKRELQSGRVVVVAGFQGLSSEDDTTTLGRGASDLTAVAMAASLKADICEIYTDVDGIYSADPRLVPDASIIPLIGYEEMLEMASLGAKMNPRSIEMAAVHEVPMMITSSFNRYAKGTRIGNVGGNDDDMEIRKSITSIATERSVARITLQGIDRPPGNCGGNINAARRRRH